MIPAWHQRLGRCVVSAWRPALKTGVWLLCISVPLSFAVLLLKVSGLFTEVVYSEKKDMNFTGSDSALVVAGYEEVLYISPGKEFSCRVGITARFYGSGRELFESAYSGMPKKNIVLDSNESMKELGFIVAGSFKNMANTMMKQMETTLEENGTARKREYH